MWIFPWPGRWRCWAMKNQHQLWHRYWGPRGMMDGGMWAWLGKRTYGFSWANKTECRRSCAISCRETLLNKEYKVGLKEAARDTWSRAPGCNVFWDKAEDGCVHIPTAFKERERERERAKHKYDMQCMHVIRYIIYLYTHVVQYTVGVPQWELGSKSIQMEMFPPWTQQFYSQLSNLVPSVLLCNGNPPKLKITRSISVYLQ